MANRENKCKVDDMTPADRIVFLRRRAEECEKAVTTFIRIQKELESMRKSSAIGAVRDRINAMVRMNRDTMETIKRDLVVTETELRCAEKPW